MKKNDIVDIIASALASKSSGALSVGRGHSEAIIRAPALALYNARGGYNTSYTSIKGARAFVSEYDVRVMLRADPSEISVPKNAIISPLAEDIILEKNVKINYV
ncbi:MAG: hypothetical protein QME32_06000 [Endomicrobiia bacterium]|nr:hypothetical protein [Endomicrobiia bacterium]